MGDIVAVKTYAIRLDDDEYTIVHTALNRLWNSLDRSDDEGYRSAVNDVVVMFQEGK